MSWPVRAARFAAPGFAVAVLILAPTAPGEGSAASAPGGVVSPQAHAGPRAIGPRPTAPPVIRDLRAEPASIEEGDRVEFVAVVEADDVAGLYYRWDFGDGTDPTEGVGASSVGHRFEDGEEGGSAYEVTLTVTDNEGGSDQASVRVDVANVAPRIETMERDGASLEDAPMVFVGAASDPGATDELTFVWDFGDGATAQGRQVEHRYGVPGPYTVTLRVDDGDGGTDERSLGVVIGEGGAFSVSGDVQVPEAELTMSSVSGAVTGNGMCQVRLQLTIEDEAGLGFQVVFPRGMAAGTYTIGAATEDAGIWNDEFASPGTFTATAGVDRKYDPPERSLFGFWSTGGSITVDHFDGERLEATFSLSLRERTVESARPPPRRVQIDGWFARAVGSSFMRMGSIPGSFYLCEVGRAPMQVIAFEPENGAENVDLDEPVIEVAFDTPIEETTLHDRTFLLEYRLPDIGLSGEEFQEVDGALVANEAGTYRFVPSAPLLDGVVYRATVVGGEEGVRGAEGELLGGDRSWRFSTLVEPDVRVAVFQVARNAPLVPGKTTLARVYVDWREKADVHPDWQVMRFPGRVEVEVNGTGVYPAEDPATLRRPDRFSEEDSAQARNSVNFFGWEPPATGGTSTFTAIVEPADQQVSTPRRFESAPVEIRHHTGAATVTYEARRILVASWEDGVPAAAAGLVSDILRGGADFTVQNFPVVDVQGGLGDLPVDEPFMLTYENSEGLQVYFDPFTPGTSYRDDVLARMAHDQLAPHTDADMLILFFPAEIQNLAGFRYDFPTPTIGLFVSDGADPQSVQKGVGTIAHEFGHAFGLPHASACPAKEFQSCLNQGKEGSDDIEGFRLALDGTGGANKSKTEGNAEASSTRAVLSLMYPDGIGAPGLFILNDQYAELLEHPELSAWAPAPSPAGGDPFFRAFVPERRAEAGPSGPFVGAGGREADAAGSRSAPQSPRWILLSGLVLPGGEGVATDPVRWSEEPWPGALPDGDYTLEVLDAGGAVLDATTFGTQPFGPEHRMDVEGTLLPDSAAPGGGGWFWVSVPNVEGARALVVSRGGEVLTRLAHTPAAPTVALEAGAGAAGAGGVLTVSWSGEDPDGDPVGYLLSYSPDGATGWQALTPWTRATQARIDRTVLPAGPRPTLRVVVSDGFRQGQATMELPGG